DEVLRVLFDDIESRVCGAIVAAVRWLKPDGVHYETIGCRNFDFDLWKLRRSRSMPPSACRGWTRLVFPIRTFFASTGWFRISASRFAAPAGAPACWR